MKPAARIFQGIISATPTPLNAAGDVEAGAVRKLAEAHLAAVLAGKRDFRF